MNKEKRYETRMCVFEAGDTGCVVDIYEVYTFKEIKKIFVPLLGMEENLEEKDFTGKEDYYNRQGFRIYKGDKDE